MQARAQARRSRGLTPPSSATRLPAPAISLNPSSFVKVPHESQDGEGALSSGGDGGSGGGSGGGESKVTFESPKKPAEADDDDSDDDDLAAILPQPPGSLRARPGARPTKPLHPVAKEPERVADQINHILSRSDKRANDMRRANQVSTMHRLKIHDLSEVHGR